MAENEEQKIADLELEVPFRHRSAKENRVLFIQACVSCHDGNTYSQLTNQNKISISFLVQKGLMPPSGKMSDAEGDELQKFLDTI